MGGRAHQERERIHSTRGPRVIKRIVVEVIVIAAVLLGAIAVYDVAVAPSLSDASYCILPEDSNLGRIKGLSGGDVLKLDPYSMVCPPCGVQVDVEPRLLARGRVDVTRVLPCEEGTGTG